MSRSPRRRRDASGRADEICYVCLERADDGLPLCALECECRQMRVHGLCRTRAALAELGRRGVELLGDREDAWNGRPLVYAVLPCSICKSDCGFAFEARLEGGPRSLAELSFLSAGVSEKTETSARHALMLAGFAAHVWLFVASGSCLGVYLDAVLGFAYACYAREALVAREPIWRSAAPMRHSLVDAAVHQAICVAAGALEAFLFVCWKRSHVPFDSIDWRSFDAVVACVSTLQAAVVALLVLYLGVALASAKVAHMQSERCRPASSWRGRFRVRVRPARPGEIEALVSSRRTGE